MAKRFPVTRRQFEQWLRAQTPAASVGRPRYTCRCPLAKFVQQVTKYKGAGIYPYRWRSELLPEFAAGGELPLWAVRFVDAVDNSQKRYISAAACLAILANIPR